MAELILRTYCEHGEMDEHAICICPPPWDSCTHDSCPGGCETVLDRDRVMFPLQEGTAITVADVIDALTKEAD